VDLLQYSNAAMRFGTNYTNRATYDMTLDSSGNLGIGTSSPSGKLHVVGQSRVADSSNAANYMTFGVGANAPYGNASISTTTAGLSIVAEGAGSMTFLNNGSERARIDSSGSLLVGTTSNSFGGRVIVSNDGTATQTSLSCINTFGSGTMRQIDFFTGTNTSRIGSIESTTSLTLFNTTSDYRLKNSIAPMTGALAKVALLKPCTYKWNADGSDGQGFIAHELAEVVPECVVGEKDAVDADGKPQYQGIDTSFLVATLTAAIQEQQAIIESLKARLDAANL